MNRCSIYNVAFGGDGVGRIYGLAVFVPFTLPDELVEVEITQKKKNFAKAKLHTILEQNKDRVIAPCPYFGTCGGCRLQHASYPLQLELKQKFVQDSLKRIGNIHFPVPPVTPSSTPFGYRRHISLKLKLSGKSLRLGFATVEGSHIPVNSCLLLEATETANPIIPFLQTVFSKVDPTLPLSGSIIKIIKHSQGRYLITCSLVAPLPIRQQDLLKNALSSNPSIAGSILKTPAQVLESGDIHPFFTHKDLTFNYSPFGFVQNHPEQSGHIYDWTLKSNNHSKKILDLYCGIGISGLLLAKEGKKVVGVELNPISIELAGQNAQQNNIEGAEFVCDSAESSTRKILKSFKPDALILNPPKAGIAPEILKEFKNSSVELITYISCNPPTLARDLAHLALEGFELEDLQAFDMFPQTTHVEVTARLVRKKITAHLA